MSVVDFQENIIYKKQAVVGFCLQAIVHRLLP